MRPNYTPSAEEVHQTQLAIARRKGELAAAEWPKAWREQMDEHQRRHDANTLALQAAIVAMEKSHRATLEIHRSAINRAGARIANLEHQLGIERAAREKLEATPRQTINLSIPERETTVRLDVPAPSVNVNVPPRRMQTEVERDKSGRIARTTSTELPA